MRYYGLRDRFLRNERKMERGEEWQGLGAAVALEARGEILFMCHCCSFDYLVSLYQCTASCLKVMSFFRSACSWTCELEWGLEKFEMGTATGFE